MKEKQIKGSKEKRKEQENNGQLIKRRVSKNGKEKRKGGKGNGRPHHSSARHGLIKHAPIFVQGNW